MSGSNSNDITPSQTPVSCSNAPKFGTLVPNRIFVGGIHTDTTESELYDIFSAYGNVVATKIIGDRAGVSKGYGFVTFETEEEARRVQNEENIVLKDRKLNVAPAIKKQQPFSRNFASDMSSPDTCSSIDTCDSTMSRGVVGNANEWGAVASPNPAGEPAPMSSNAVYYGSGVPYAYPGIYNYVPSEPNSCQYPQQSYVLYSPVYIPQPYTPTTPQLHWGGATFRWPSQVGYEQSSSSSQTSVAPTATSPSVPYAYSLSSGPSTPTTTVSNSGQKGKSGAPSNPGLSQNVGDKAGVYYQTLPTGATVPAATYAFPMPYQYAVTPQQRVGDGCDPTAAGTTPTESPPYQQGMFQKGARKHMSNYSPRKGPAFSNHQNYNTRHFSPQRSFKPKFFEGNVSSQQYSDGKSISGSHVGSLTPPSTPMPVKSSINGNEHVADATNRMKTLKFRD
ncbi:hypothetical protein CHUAL_003177 [Chamberlinius hualienensis]